MHSEEKILIDKQTLLSQLLGEQQELTAVESFAQKHENDIFPAQQQYYEHAILRTIEDLVLIDDLN